MSDDYEIRSLQRDVHQLERELADVKDDLKWRDKKFDALESKFNDLCDVLVNFATRHFNPEKTTLGVDIANIKDKGD